MKRKLLLYMLSIAMSFALISAGCGDKGGDPPVDPDPKGKVTVTVIDDETESPSANAKVRLYYSRDSMNTNRTYLSGNADTNGIKTFDNVPARSYYVKADLGDAFASQQIYVTNGETTTATLRIKDVGHLRVNVKVGSEIGNPAGGAEVSIAWNLDSAYAGKFLRTEYTPSDGSDMGRVIFMDLPRREYCIYAELSDLKNYKEDVMIQKPNATNPYTDETIAVK